MRRIPPHWYGVLLALAIYGTILAIFFGFLYWAAEADARPFPGKQTDLRCKKHSNLCKVTVTNKWETCHLRVRKSVLGDTRVTYYFCRSKIDPTETESSVESPSLIEIPV